MKAAAFGQARGFDALLRIMEEGVVLHGADGSVAMCSAAAERILGITAGRLVGSRGLFVGLEPLDESGTPLRLDDEPANVALRTRKPCELRTVGFRRADGEQAWAELRATPLFRSGARKPAGALTVLLDVTVKKSVELRLRGTHRMEAIGRLAGSVAHDFNNVLTAVLGYNDKLLRTLSPTDPRRYEVEEVRRAAQRGVGLTRQLLAFSRRQVLEPQVLDLREVVSEMWGVLQMLIGEGIRLSVEPATSLPKVRVDRTQLEQVVLNLAINARDAMASGGVLRIETADVELDRAFEEAHPGSRRGRYARLSVEDNGCGMDAAIQARIFEPFFTTKPREKGTGLGLATVYGIVKQSQGYIDVDSTPGRGTAFYIYLPACSEGADSLPCAIDCGSAPQPPETVLLVEDDDQVRMLAKRVLEEHGYNVLEAADGLSALDLLERHSGRIHALVTDVVMPGLGGRELARRVAERMPGLPVLYLSAYTELDLSKAGEAGAGASFLAKPFEAHELIERLRDVLAGVGAG